MKTENLNNKVKFIIEGALNKKNYLNRYDAVRDFIYYTSKRIIVLIYELWRAFEFVCKVFAKTITFAMKHFWSVVFVIVFFVAGIFIGLNIEKFDYLKDNNESTCVAGDVGCGVAEYVSELKKQYKIRDTNMYSNVKRLLKRKE